MLCWVRPTYFFLCAAAICLAGCSGAGDQPELGQVTGTVSLDGVPLEHAILTFRPREGRPSTGITDSQGVYRLNYLYNVTGARIGEHTVSISTEDFVENVETGESKFIPELLGPNYNKQTTLTASVAEGNNTIDFDLLSEPGGKPVRSEIQNELQRQSKE